MTYKVRMQEKQEGNKEAAVPVATLILINANENSQESLGLTMNATYCLLRHLLQLNISCSHSDPCQRCIHSYTGLSGPSLSVWFISPLLITTPVLFIFMLIYISYCIDTREKLHLHSPVCSAQIVNWKWKAIWFDPYFYFLFPSHFSVCRIFKYFKTGSS